MSTWTAPDLSSEDLETLGQILLESYPESSLAGSIAEGAASNAATLARGVAAELDPAVEAWTQPCPKCPAMAACRLMHAGPHHAELRCPACGYHQWLARPRKATRAEARARRDRDVGTLDLGGDPP